MKTIAYRFVSLSLVALKMPDKHRVSSLNRTFYLLQNQRTQKTSPCDDVGEGTGIRRILPTYSQIA